MDRFDQISTFSRLTQVSRETIVSLNKYEELLIKANKTLNLIGKSTINSIWTRHFLDSYQVIDFVDENDRTIVDLGSGAGFPGLVIEIIARERKLPLKMKLVEKSPKKAKFLNETINELKLNVEVINKDILKEGTLLEEQVFVARAFKPLGIILQLMHNQAKNCKKLFVFLGKTGPREILQASKSWDMQYKQRVSITSSDSTLIEINKLIKK